LGRELIVALPSREGRLLMFPLPLRERVRVRGDVNLFY